MDQRQRFQDNFGPRYSYAMDNAPVQRYSYSDETLKRASDALEAYYREMQAGSQYDAQFLTRMIDRYGPRAGLMINNIAQSLPMPRRDFAAGLLSSEDFEDTPERLSDLPEGEIRRNQIGHVADLVKRYGLLGLIGMGKGLMD